MSIRIETLGTLRITRDGSSLAELPAQPFRAALLLYVSLERIATRDALTALLWPDRETERARHSLSQTLYELRRVLGEEWVGTNGDRLECAPTTWVDAAEFVAAVEAERDDAALALYHGPMLEGVHLDTTPAFEQWLDRHRSHLARLYQRLCRRACATRAERGDAEGALEVARRWVDADPLDDEAQHRLIELLARAGRRAEALKQYEGYEALIARELQVEPLDDTKALVERLRGGEGEAATFRAPAADDQPPATVARVASAATVVTPSAAPPRRRRPMRFVITAAAVLVIGALVVGSVARSGRDTGTASLDPHGVAVLPFVNLSADAEQEYFSDGITEDVLTSLSRIRDLRVISRTSTTRYRRAELSMRDVAGELGVRYILEGSVRRHGERVRITAQLIDAANDAHVWAETFDRDVGDVFRIQSEIAQRIADALRHQLSPADRARIARGGTPNVLAYDLMLRGREYLNRPGDADGRKFGPAIGFFHRALEVDPGYARAFVGLSETFRRHPHLPPHAAIDSALHYGRMAVRADSQLADAAAALGAAHLLAGERDAAEAELRRALALDPNQADAMSELALLGALNGRLDEAARWQQRAVAVDPTSASRLVGLGEYLFDLGDLDGAGRAFARAVEFAPDFPEANFLLAHVHLLRGYPDRADEQMRALDAAAADHPGTPVLLGRYHAQRGRYADADRYLAASRLGAARVFRAYVARKTGDQARAAELLRFPPERLRQWDAIGFVPPPRLRFNLQLLGGDHDGALETLEETWRSGMRAVSRDPPELGIYWIDAEPFLDELRDDPRFAPLLRRMRAELDSMRLLVPDEGASDARRRPLTVR